MFYYLVNIHLLFLVEVWAKKAHDLEGLYINSPREHDLWDGTKWSQLHTNLLIHLFSLCIWVHLFWPQRYGVNKLLICRHSRSWAFFVPSSTKNNKYTIIRLLWCHLVNTTWLIKKKDENIKIPIHWPGIYTADQIGSFGQNKVHPDTY